MVRAGNGYAIYLNGEFERWYPGKDRAQSCFEFFRGIVSDTVTVDLVDFLTGEILASTAD